MRQRMIIESADARAVIHEGDTVYMNCSGRRVHSVVNCGRFSCNNDVFDEYVELVKREISSDILNPKARRA